MRLSKKIEGSILWLKCKNCSAEFPSFVFSGETDMSTAGLRTLTNLESKRLYIYEEPNTSACGSEVELISVKEEKSVPGESFQEFQRRFHEKKPCYFYKCICCADGTASVTSRLSKDELSEKGYSLVQL